MNYFQNDFINVGYTKNQSDDKKSRNFNINSTFLESNFFSNGSQWEQDFDLDPKNVFYQ